MEVQDCGQALGSASSLSPGDEVSAGSSMETGVYSPTLCAGL